jgi:hypothetical protein
MLTPELTGQVRNAIKEEKKEEPSDFSRPGQKVDAPESKVQIPNAQQESLQQSNLGLKFGKSVNRSRTTRLTRDELDLAVKAGAPKAQDDSGFTLPTPVVPKAFDPLTSIAPPNHGPGKVSELGAPRQAPRVENNQPPLMQPTSQQNSFSQPAGPGQFSAPQHFAPPQQFSSATQFSHGSQPAAQVQPVVAKGQASKGASKIVGFLISFDSDPNGEVYEIRAGRKLITSRPTDHGEYFLIEHETISPLHAILRTTKDGRLQVLDQLSEHGTGITREGESEEIEVAGGLELIQNGDVLRFGERRFLVSLLPIK